MTDIAGKNARIAKNTLLLYVRMIFTMAITLYTSRVVLNTLGVEDFGIYNVVGGIVTLFGFLNTAMATGTQRYLIFEIARHDYNKLQNVFNTSIVIHGVIAVLILALAETVGFWFLCNKMTIPAERINAAIWVYQFSVLSSVIMVMSVPYNAIIIAYEKMSAFAYISILEVFLKLLVVYLLLWGNIDKLKLYAILIFIVQLCIRMIYSMYCKYHFKATKFRKSYDKQLFKEMLCFAGWNLWGNCAAVAFNHGLNIMLNVFFGPVVNAARGIAIQVQGAVAQFTLNFQTALNPQITKSYAINDYAYMHNLIYKSSRITFYLILILSLPIIIETEFVLMIWLKNVPEYTGTFLRLMLCITIIDAIANPLMVSATATGRVKLYQSVIGGILLLILPVSYLVLKMGGNPVSVFIVHLSICIVAFIVRLLIIRSMVRLSIRLYFTEVFLKCIFVLILSAFIPLVLKYYLADSMMSFCIISISCVTSSFYFIYRVGFTKSERKFIKAKSVQMVSIFLK